MATFILGLFLGGFLGFCTACLLVAAKMGEK